MLKKKLMVMGLLGAALITSSVSAKNDIKININGQDVKTDVAPIIQNERTMVPLRVVSENLGVEVSWNQDTKEVTLEDENLNAKFKIGSKTYQANGKKAKTDVAPIVYEDRTLVPIRVIAETLGREVNWNNDTRTVLINDAAVGNFQKTPEKKSQNTFEEAYVKRVVDGDTAVLVINNKEYKLRMILVDTPESVHPKKGLEYYGKEASDYTKAQLTGKTVYLQKDVSDTDRYGRVLRYVWIKRPATNEPTKDEVKNYCYNAILIKEGYGQLATFPPDVKYVDIFKGLERDARNSKRGLWQNPERIGERLDKKEVAKKENKAAQVESKEAIANNKIQGNKNSKIYHVPGGKSYGKVSPQNSVWFDTEDDAVAAGYRKAKQ